MPEELKPTASPAGAPAAATAASVPSAEKATPAATSDVQATAVAGEPKAEKPEVPVYDDAYVQKAREEAARAERERIEKTDIAKLKSRADKLSNQLKRRQDVEAQARLQAAEAAAQTGDWEQAYKQAATTVQMQQATAAEGQREQEVNVWLSDVMQKMGIEPDEQLQASLAQIPIDDPNYPYYMLGTVAQQGLERERAKSEALAKEAEKAKSEVKKLTDALPAMMEAAIVKYNAKAGVTEADTALPGQSRSLDPDDLTELSVPKLVKLGIKQRRAGKA